MIIFGIAEIIFGLVYTFTFILIFIAIYHYRRFGLKGDIFGRSFVTVFLVATLVLLIVNGVTLLRLRSLDASTFWKTLGQEINWVPQPFEE